MRLIRQTRKSVFQCAVDLRHETGNVSPVRSTSITAGIPTGTNLNLSRCYWIFEKWIHKNWPEINTWDLLHTHLGFRWRLAASWRRRSGLHLGRSLAAGGLRSGRHLPNPPELLRRHQHLLLSLLRHHLRHLVTEKQDKYNQLFLSLPLDKCVCVWWMVNRS